MAMDSQRAVIGCDDTRALIFDMHSGRLVRSLPPNPGPVTALYVSKMDDFLITAGLLGCNLSFAIGNSFF